MNPIKRGTYMYIERLAADCQPMMDSQTHLSWARPDQCDIELLDQLWMEMENLENSLHARKKLSISTEHTCIMLSG